MPSKYCSVPTRHCSPAHLRSRRHFGGITTAEDGLALTPVPPRALETAATPSICWWTLTRRDTTYFDDLSIHKGWGETGILPRVRCAANKTQLPWGGGGGFNGVAEGLFRGNVVDAKGVRRLVQFWLDIRSSLKIQPVLGEASGAQRRRVHS